MSKKPGWVSHSILQPACRAWLRGQGLTAGWFPGPLRDSTLPKPQAGVIDVVLFGDFLDQISHFKQWPSECKRFRLWVLCQASKKVCVDVLGFRSDEIGVIPRSAILTKTRGKQLPPLDSSFTLVYGGRFAVMKNFDIFLRVASRLQVHCGLRNMKVLASGFYPEPERIASLQFDYLMLKLPWINPPVLRTDLKPLDWVKSVKGKTVLMNLSRHRHEDFGVSVAEAQRAGWPCILSDWGGHRDVSGPGVMKVPAHLLPGEEQIRYVNEELEVKKICAFILRKWTSVKPQAIPRTALRIPRSVDTARIQQLETLDWKPIKKLGSRRWMLREEATEFRLNYDRAFGLSKSHS